MAIGKNDRATNLPIQQHLDNIAQAIVAGEAAAFVGAGLSAIAGAPTWDHVTHRLANGLIPRSVVTDPLLIAQFYRNQHSDQKFHAVLRDLVKQAPLAPSRVHRLLCSLPVRLVFTTNYDSLLEATYAQLGVPAHVVAEDEDFATWSERREVQIVKLHGDLERQRTIVASDEDYTRTSGRDSFLRFKLLDALACRTVLFVGYSMRDPDISMLYSRVLSGLGRAKRPAYLLTLETDPHVLGEWRRRSVIPIQVPVSDGDNPDTAIGDLLEDLHEAVATTRNRLTLPPRDSAGKKCDILIVDDEPSICRYIEVAVEFMLPQLSIAIAVDGVEALEKIEELQPRLVLTDLRMPRLDGLEVIMRTRRSSSAYQPLFLVLTGAPELAADIGVPVVLKPFDIQDVVQRIKHLLSMSDVAP